MRESCVIEGCDTTPHSHKMCIKHYTRWYKYGDPHKRLALRGATLREKLEHYSKVDDNGCWLWQGALNHSGYGVTNHNKKYMRAHRASYEEFVGAVPVGMVIDHKITCPKRCINPEHLRIATTKQNAENLEGASKGNPSTYRGVSWNKPQKRWVARVGHQGKYYHLGCFPSYELHIAGYRTMLKRMELFTYNDVDRSHFE